MAGWGESWTDNKMFKLQEEKKRQQAVVKLFLANHPEYDSKNDANNKELVDLIELSKRPFTIETIEWAYASLFAGTKNFYKKISTALSNTSFNDALSLNTYQVPFQTVGMGTKFVTVSDNELVDKEPEVQYDKDIRPTTTVRRIKEDD